jgi:hypothetical protein
VATLIPSALSAQITTCNGTKQDKSQSHNSNSQSKVPITKDSSSVFSCCFLNFFYGIRKYTQAKKKCHHQAQLKGEGGRSTFHEKSFFPFTHNMHLIHPYERNFGEHLIVWEQFYLTFYINL